MKAIAAILLICLASTVCAETQIDAKIIDQLGALVLETLQSALQSSLNAVVNFVLSEGVVLLSNLGLIGKRELVPALQELGTALLNNLLSTVLASVDLTNLVSLFGKREIVPALQELGTALLNNLLSTVLATVDVSSLGSIISLLGIGKRQILDNLLAQLADLAGAVVNQLLVSIIGKRDAKFIDQITELVISLANNVLAQLIGSIDLSALSGLASLIGIGRRDLAAARIQSVIDTIINNFLVAGQEILTQGAAILLGSLLNLAAGIGKRDLVAEILGALSELGGQLLNQVLLQVLAGIGKRDLIDDIWAQLTDLAGVVVGNLVNQLLISIIGKRELVPALQELGTALLNNLLSTVLASVDLTNLVSLFGKRELVPALQELGTALLNNLLSTVLASVDLTNLVSLLGKREISQEKFIDIVIDFVVDGVNSAFNWLLSWGVVGLSNLGIIGKRDTTRILNALQELALALANNLLSTAISAVDPALVSTVLTVLGK